MRILSSFLPVLAVAACDFKGPSNGNQDRLTFSEASAPKIPTAFQGEWVADQASCRSGEPRHAGDYLWITPDKINGNPVKAIVQRSPGDLEVSAEGGVSDRGYRLMLAKDGRRLSDAYDDRTASPTLTKCPDHA